MGVFTRDDSPYYWLYLEPTKEKEPTDIRCDGPTPQQRKDAKERARIRYHDRLKELAEESKPDPNEKPEILLRDFVPWYEKNVLSNHRGQQREKDAIPHLLRGFGDLLLTDITKAKVKEWHQGRLTTPTVVAKKKHVKARIVSATPSTVNRETDVLKSILQAAVPDYLVASPLFGMKRLKTKTPRRALLSEADEAKLLPVMAPDDAALLVLGMDSLVRLQDLLDIQREHDEGKQIWVDDPKSGGGFYVAVSRRARKRLDAIPNDGPYYFTRRRRPKTEHGRRNAVKQMLQRACKAAGVKYGRSKGGITFHWATRRTGTTRMLNRGVGIATVQKLGGWKKPDVPLSIYHEIMDEAAHAAVNIVGRKTRSRSRSIPATAAKAKNPQQKAS